MIAIVVDFIVGGIVTAFKAALWWMPSILFHELGHVVGAMLVGFCPKFFELGRGKILCRVKWLEIRRCFFVGAAITLPAYEDCRLNSARLIFATLMGPAFSVWLMWFAFSSGMPGLTMANAFLLLHVGDGPKSDLGQIRGYVRDLIKGSK